MYAVFKEFAPRLKAVPDGFARTDEGDVVSVQQGIGLAEFEMAVLTVDVPGFAASDAYVHGLRAVDERIHDALGQAAVAGQHDVHAREGPQDGDVVQAVVGGAQVPVGDAAADTQQFDGVAAVGDVHFDLLEAAGDVEAGRAAAEDFLAAVGEAGADADGVLFGNAAFDELGGQFFGEIAQGYGSAGVGGHSHDVLVSAGATQQLGCETLSAVCHRNSSSSSLMRRVISSRAWAYCASSGTPWCHLATPSM